MARLFRLWEKKRGDRRTGSKFLSGLGEAVFFAALFVLGLVSVASMVTVQVLYSTPNELYLSGWIFWLQLLVMISFILIGGAGVAFTVLQVGASAERRSAMAARAANIELLQETQPSPKEFPTVPRDKSITDSPGVRLTFRLPIAYSPVWKFVAAAIGCVVVMGGASVLVILAWEGHRSGDADWPLTLVAGPLVIVGIGTVYYFVRQLLIYTGIGPTAVEISEHPLRPGGNYRVFVSQTGRLALHKLELVLICEEEATFHQGTDVRTERQRVHEAVIFERSDFRVDQSEPLEEECDLHIPEQAMHSFQSNCNSVHWQLVVRGEAAGLPEFERPFPVIINPHAAEEENSE